MSKIFSTTQTLGCSVDNVRIDLMKDQTTFFIRHTSLTWKYKFSSMMGNADF